MKNMTTDYTKLIPEMQDWNNGKGIDVESWVGCTGNFRLAIGYSTIFWPEFVEFEGYVLRKGFSVEGLRSLEKNYAGKYPSPKKTIEATMNHLHIADIQYCGCEDFTHERVIFLGRILREIHQAKLVWQFPEKAFEVHFDESNPDPSDWGYVLTFSQKDS